MYLAKMEIQGFKTFAQKTMLLFPGAKENHHAVTCIVGPNGSGKSNLADAIRWALGEQSLKLLRGRRSEDVIFSGSAGRGRAGFAEVSLTFQNNDRSMPIDFSEVVMTRRLYRDGESAYLLNGTPTRLIDLRLLLAQANVGQQSYSVIGQGMVDHILISSPEERKAFFDDATGVRPLQLKRHETMLKLKRTYENLNEVDMLLREIEPRLKSLKRQVSRLEKREKLEQELHAFQQEYYGGLWWQLQDELSSVRVRHQVIAQEIGKATAEMNVFEQKVVTMETAERAEHTPDAGLLVLQKAYQETQKKRVQLRDEEFDIQRQMELAKVRSQSNWAPLPLSKIISEVEELTKNQEIILEKLRTVKVIDELQMVEEMVTLSLKRSTTLVGRLQRPAPEDFKPDPANLSRLEAIKKERSVCEFELNRLEHELETHTKQEHAQRTELFDFQRGLREQQRNLHLLENQRNEIQIDLARLEEREHNLHREMETEMKKAAELVRNVRREKTTQGQVLFPEIQRLRYQLELIGGIDPEIVKEYEETNTRFTFLESQIADLKKAMRATEKMIDELDEKIRTQSDEAFRHINREFQRFFKILFGGGSCDLVKMTAADLKKDEDEHIALDHSLAETGQAEREQEEESIETLRKNMEKREDRIIGIDIQATPPGKKLKALNLLSGGERALTSIALISAIMAINPAPFVVLDEVDAALDEANTIRFAGILDELCKLTQFIVITHNRASMEKADVLYGVTMGEEGISHLLSIKLAEIQHLGTARH